MEDNMKSMPSSKAANINSNPLMYGNPGPAPIDMMYYPPIAAAQGGY